MTVTGYLKAGTDAAFAPKSSAWQATTAVKAGQLLHNAGILYRVTADMTTPSSFNTTNLTVVSGGGSSLAPTAVKTAGYSAAAGDLVPADATSGGITITLPTTPADKTQIVVKKIDASTNAVAVACGGSDVFNKTGGSTSISLAVQNQSLFAQYQASSGLWYVIAIDPAALGGAARLNVGTTTGTVAAGDDSRFSVGLAGANLYLARNYR
jgi:hypothetical protein